MKITKREIILSIAIVAVMLIVGFIISDGINDSLMERNQEYNTALQIVDDPELFQYGMRTNVGRAFVYGNLKAANPVTYDEIGGEYGSVSKVKEEYTMHTRTVTKTREVNGKTETYTEVETYWTWDEVSRDRIHTDIIIFLNTEFPWGTIESFYEDYITTIDRSSDVRYVYYGSRVERMGTLYAVLSNSTISNTSFYSGMSINDTIESLESGFELILFWVLWITLIGFAVCRFYYLDNKWLEDK